MDLLFNLLLISTIMEKFQWTVAGFNITLYMLVGMMFAVAVYSNGLLRGNGKLVFINNQILISKELIFVFAVIQFIFIEKTSNMLDQYIKGIFSLIIDFVILSSVCIYLHSKKNKINYPYVLNKVYILCVINVIYNMVQRIYPDIDTYIVNLSYSTITRYGLDSYGELGRLTGVFTDSNNNGVFLVVSLILLLYTSKKNIHTFKGALILNAVVLVLILVEILLTFSLTSYISLSIFIVIMFFKTNTKGKLKILTGIFFGVVLLVYFCITYDSLRQILLVKFNNLTSMFSSKYANSNVSSHFQIAIDSLKIWIHNPIVFVFGTGYNCMSEYFDKLFDLPGYKAHNYYLQNLAEYGLLGFCLVINYLKTVFNLIKKKISKHDWYLDAILIVILFANISYDSMVQNFFTLIIFLYISFNESVGSTGILETMIRERIKN